MKLNRQQIVFETKLINSERKVRLALSEEPYSVDGNTILLGYPLSRVQCDPDCALTESLADVPGHFALVQIKDDSVELASDMCGGYRLYYAENDGELLVSDSYTWVADRIGRRHLTLNQHERQYWRRHGYTTGDATLVNEIHKLPPATTVTWRDDDLIHRTYLPDYDNDPSVEEHDARVENALVECCEHLRFQPQPVVLLFSGGADSCLLAALLKRCGVSFSAVTLALDPAYPENAADCLRAQQSAEHLGIPLTVLSVDREEAFEHRDAILDRMLFDRHLSLLHFGGMAQIADRFGTDCIVVCGQAADSILSYGPTCASRGDFVARLLAMGLMPVITPAAGKLVAMHDNRQLRGAISTEEFYTAFFDQHYYYSVVHKDDPEDYADYIRSIVTRAAHSFDSPAACMMYLKLYGFVQGSDNQVVLQSARAAGIRRVLLPFTHPHLISETVRYRSKYYDLLFPKYSVRHLLKAHNVTPARPDGQNEYDATMEPLSRLQDRMSAEFDSHINRLLDRSTVRERQ